MLEQAVTTEPVEGTLQAPTEEASQVDSETPLQPVTSSETCASDNPAQPGDDSSPGPKMAMVQLGDLSGHSVQDLAQHLPNIGIHFTCKKCNISCNQMSEVLAHFTDGNCMKPVVDSPTAQGTMSPKAIPTPRKRGRPKKDTQHVPAFTVTKDEEYEELPRIAAPANLLENPNGRRTRYNTGKIKRLDVLTLLGGRVKEEPLDDDEYVPVLPPLGGPYGSRKRLADADGPNIYNPPPDGPRKRGRPRKNLKVYEQMVATDEFLESEPDFPEGVTTYIPGDDNDGNIASVTVTTEGNSKVIVVNTFKASDFECQEGDGGIEMDDGEVEGGGESVEAHGNMDEVSREAKQQSQKSSQFQSVEAQGQAETEFEKTQDSQIKSEIDQTITHESAGPGEGGTGIVTDTVAGTVTNTVTGVVTETGSESKAVMSNISRSLSFRDKIGRMRRATQRTVYSYTHSARKKRQNKCKICKQRFFYTEVELRVHTECHANQKGEQESYNCLVAECDYSSTFWNRMLDHLITHEDYRKRLQDAPFLKNIIGNFSCPICKKKFERKNNMKGHISKVHYKQDRECEICHMTLTAVDDKTYKRHVEKCQNLLFQCSHCEYKTPVSANMRKHMKIHLGQGFTCEVCQAVFPSKQRYNVHREIHEKTRRQFMCENCGQAFVSQDAVKKHVVRFHTEATTIYACPHEDCPFTSKISTDLKKHTASVHNKKFRCPSCPFQSNSTSAYEQHQEYHKPGRSYRCTYAACFYSGATVKQLANHISQVHKLSSKHECPVCHKFYKKKTHLARHLVAHTGDKPYVCLDCNLAFASHSTYYRHRQRTGHDAKREGVVSVPQNITIQYVSPQEMAMAEEDGAQNLQYGLQQAFEVVDEGENNGVQYMTTSTDGTMVDMVNGETAEQVGTQSVIILENENGEQVTYLLKMGADDNAPATMVTEDGVEMDAALAQQIQAQLQQLQGGEETMEVMGGGEEEGEGVKQEDMVIVGEQVDVQMARGEIMEEEAETQVVYTTTTVTNQTHDEQAQMMLGVQQVAMAMEEEGGQLAEVETAEQTAEAVGEQTMLLMHPDGVVEQTTIEQAVEESNGNVEEVLDQSWIQMTQDGGLVTSEGLQVQQAPSDLQEIQQVIYEESVVEVDNSHTGGSEGPEGRQYAIVLLPSSSASGDEPEAALSMLQLQSGSNVVISDQEATQLLLQQQQQLQQEQQQLQQEQQQLQQEQQEQQQEQEA